MRPSVTTSKSINLEQLDRELGGYGLCADPNDPMSTLVMTADDSPVTHGQLEAAVSAHVAIFPPSRDELRTSAIAKLAALGLTEEEAAALVGQ